LPRLHRPAWWVQLNVQADITNADGANPHNVHSRIVVVAELWEKQTEGPTLSRTLNEAPLARRGVPANLLK
jgi:hypothetical protein